MRGDAVRGDTVRAEHAARPATAWFAAKRPSSGADARSTEDLAAGWQGGQTASPPVHGDQTSAGLPVRIPQANIFPGTASGMPVRDAGAAGGMPASRQAPTDHQREHPTGPQPVSLPQRSADQARSRLSGFQLGSREAENRTPRAGEEASR